MAQPYDVMTYLLDKENIRDTLLRMVPPTPPLYTSVTSIYNYRQTSSHSRYCM